MSFSPVVAHGSLLTIVAVTMSFAPSTVRAMVAVDAAESGATVTSTNPPVMYDPLGMAPSLDDSAADAPPFTANVYVPVHVFLRPVPPMMGI
jgi:hypothetical protein